MYFIYMNKENTWEALLQQCVPPSVAQAEPHWVPAKHLPPTLQVLANSSTDAGARPTCITLMPPSGIAQGGSCAGDLP